MDQPHVVLAGATGDQGRRTALALTELGAHVQALVRPGSAPAAQRALRAAGSTVTHVDLADVDALAAALAGASCVVSTLGGLREVIINRQSALLDAAVQAGVPRFIPSDYSADYTKTVAGGNRNFDLRREFLARAHQAPIAVTSIFNGAFMDMLGAEMPIIQPRIRRVLYWGDRSQPLDFTSRDDVAAYTARAALDDTAPRTLRIAGATVNAAQIAAAMSEVTGRPYRTLPAGSLGSLSLMIRVAKLVAPQPDAAFPAWQGMQYMRDQFAGLVQLTPLDNDRYPDMRWTPLRARLEQRYGTVTAPKPVPA